VTAAKNALHAIAQGLGKEKVQQETVLIEIGQTEETAVTETESARDLIGTEDPDPETDTKKGVTMIAETDHLEAAGMTGGTDKTTEEVVGEAMAVIEEVEETTVEIELRKKLVTTISLAQRGDLLPQKILFLSPSARDLAQLGMLGLLASSK